MSAVPQAIQAAVALKGGQGKRPVFEDDPLVAAVYAVAEAMEDGYTSDRIFEVKPSGNLVVGIKNISSGHRPLVTIMVPTTSTYGEWSGLKRA